MVKIRLARLGNSHRPFYRIVVQKSTAGRNSSAIETIGTYNPLTNPKKVELQSDRAMHWLMNGAQPTETVAIILKREGVLEEFFNQRPNAKKKYGFLDKTTAAMSMESVIESPQAVKEAEAPAAEAPAEEAKAEEAPVEEAKAEEVKAEEAPAEEAPAEAEEAKSE